MNERYVFGSKNWGRPHFIYTCLAKCKEHLGGQQILKSNIHYNRYPAGRLSSDPINLGWYITASNQKIYHHTSIAIEPPISMETIAHS